MNDQDIKAGVLSILIDFLHVSKDTLESAGEEEALTGPAICLDGLDLAYLYLEIEKRFQIHIEEQSILNYEYNTIHGIVDCIRRAFDDKVGSHRKEV